MAQNWLGLWLGKWVGNWLGKLGAGAGVVEKAEQFFYAEPEVNRVFSGTSEISQTFWREERR
jgi:hypothetical protein